MAEKRTIIGIELKVKGSEQLTAKIAEAKAELAATTQEIKQLEKEQKKAFNPTEVLKYEQAIGAAKTRQLELKNSLKLLSKEADTQRQTLLAVGSDASDSYDALDARLKVLRRSFKQLSDEERNAETGQELLKNISKLDTELKKLDAAQGVYFRNVGNYPTAILEAFKQTGQTDKLAAALKGLANDNEKLEMRAKELGEEYEKTFNSASVESKQAREKIIKELTAIDKQIKENTANIKKFGDEAGNAGDKAGGGVSGRKIKKASRLAGLGAIGDVAAGAADLQSVLGGLGAAGAAAFGVFAAGGLVFKGIQALEELNKQIGATRGQVKELSGASGAELEAFTTDVRGIASAFGATEEEILKEVEETQKATGKSFSESLKQVESAYLTTAKNSGVLTDSIEEQLEASKQLAGAQSELAKRFNDTGINTGQLGTKLKTGFFNALIAIFDALRPLVKSFFDYGKAVGAVVKSLFSGERASSILSKAFKVLSVPAKQVGILFKFVTDKLTAVVQSVADFINNSPFIQEALAFIGDGFEKLLDYILGLPEALGRALTGVENFVRDSLSFITGGLIDDAATAAAAAEAKQAGQFIGEAFVGAFGQAAATIENQTAVTFAGQQAFAQAVAAGKSLGEAFVEAEAAAIAEGERLGLKRKAPAQDEETLKQLQESNKKRIEALEEARKKREEEAKKLIESENDSAAKLEAVIRESGERVADLSVSLIKNEFERRIKEINTEKDREIKARRQAIEEERDARLEQLRSAAELTDSDASVRAKFGDRQQIEQKIQQASEATATAIQNETNAINAARERQIGELRQQRQRAVEEAAASIDNAALGDAISQLQRDISLQEQKRDAIKLRFETDQKSLDASVANAKTRLQTLQDAGLIDEKEARAQLRQIESEAIEGAARISEKRIAAEQKAATEIAKQQEQLAILELENNKRTIEQTKNERIEAIQAQAEQQLLTEQQAQEEIARIQADAAQQQVSAQEQVGLQIAQLQQAQRDGEIAAAQELAQIQDEINANLFAQQRQRQQEYFQNLNQSVQAFSNAFTQGVEIADNLFAASDNRQKDRIETRYQEELQRANGNAIAIAEAERKKELELQKIQQEAARRKQRIDAAQAIINGALAVTNILANTPDPTGFFTIARITAAVALTAAQVDKILSEKFAEGGELPAGGNGEIKGNSHANGGVRFIWNGQRVEAEGGEWMTDNGLGNKVIINKKSTQRYKSLLSAIDRAGNFAGRNELLSAINVRGGGVPFASGGILPQRLSPAPSVFAQLGASLTAPVGAPSNSLPDMQPLIDATQAALVLAAAANNRIDNISVTVDPREVLVQGKKMQDIYQTQTIDNTKV